VSTGISITGIPAEVNERLNLLVFVIEGGLTSVVKRGENSGRTLQHEAVVRSMTHAATLERGATFPFVTTARSRFRDEHLRPDHPWQVVAILQGQKTRRIWASGIR
jgi:hypothetical protein